MRGFILYNGPENSDINALLKEAKESNIDIEVVNPRKIAVLVNEKNKKLFIKGKEITPPDFALVVFVNDPIYGNSAVAQQLESMGVLCINKVGSAKTTNDKLKTMQLLAEAGIPIPKTMLVRFPFDFELFEKEFNYPVILKLVFGRQGKGVVLVNNKKELENILTIARAGQIKEELIIQEYIETSKGRNIRVIVIGKRALVSVVRENPNENDFRSNVAVGGKESYYPLDDKLKNICNKIAQKLDLFIAGIDILFGKEGYVVCEVNSIPGFYGDYKELYNNINIPKELFKAIKNELHR